MKYSLLRPLVWQLVIAGLTSMFVSRAYADQVEINRPDTVTVSKNADTVEFTFEVVNTGVPIKLNVDIGQITEFVSPQLGDTKNHVLSTNSIIGTTCGTLGVKQSCTVNALYDVLNGDPFNKVNPARDGIWIAGLHVPWTSSGEKGTAASYAGVIISVSSVGANAVPEPSTWAMILLGFGGLGFMGYRKARVATA